MIWTILGVSVAILAFFCISVAETFVGKPIFESNRVYIAAVLTAAGVVAWFVGRHSAGRRRAQENEEGDTASRSFVLWDLRYWGPMFLAFGVITLFIRPLRQMQTVAAAPPPAPPPKVAVVEPEPAPEPRKTNAPAVFPPLKMQGLIFRENRPFAIINGDSYTIGDHVGEVEVKAIDRTSVMLELAGTIKRLDLE